MIRHDGRQADLPASRHAITGPVIFEGMQFLAARASQMCVIEAVRT